MSQDVFEQRRLSLRQSAVQRSHSVVSGRGCEATNVFQVSYSDLSYCGAGCWSCFVRDKGVVWLQWLSRL